jgi:hypothetical protein
MLPQDQICAIKEQAAQVLKHRRGSNLNEPYQEIRVALCLMPYMGLFRQFAPFRAPFQEGVA